MAPSTSVERPVSRPSPAEAARAGLLKLYHDDESTDFTITCGKDTYRVHKLVIGLQSEYIAKAIRNGFKEALEARIDLKVSATDWSCDHPEAVRLMIHYMYHLDYEADGKKAAGTRKGDGQARRKKLKTSNPPKDARDAAPGPEGDEAMLTHARVFAVAVKYDMPALRLLAAEKIEPAIRKNLKDTSFAHLITEVHLSTDESVRELRTIVARTILKNKMLLQKKDVADAINQINGLAYDLLVQSGGMALNIKGVDETNTRDSDTGSSSGEPY
ncbi:uncharacterized protein RCC_00817 [Ramularia collo-cygni]|uniref:BTB domain-containing protein n=1 Tax=Ramularia collo-cygni TaxID=112498 RepID=A0A2D3UND7_9PEZI|nr:uncharacterized protein RCC_00817 [Ramularia collo-cygni]CZT14878.1 uncharacterized protein RCC_00817 [Ramularia collo-cygni]